MTGRRVRLLTLAALVLLAAVCGPRFEVTNSIAFLIPKEARTEEATLALGIIQSPLVQRMTLGVSGGPGAEAVGRALARELAHHEEVAWVEADQGEDEARQIYDVYFDHRLELASLEPEHDVGIRLEPPSLRAAARRLRARLAGPEAMIHARLAPADPLGLFWDFVKRARTFRGRIDPSTDAGDRRVFYPIQVGLRSSPFDSDRQRPLIDFIESTFSRLADASGAEPVLEMSGMNRFAISSEDSIRADVRLISAVSIIAVVTVFLLVFRSVKSLLAAFVVPLAGFLTALSTALVVAPPVHGLTLAFGFALIGVAIDYPIHVMTHQAFREGAGDTGIAGLGIGRSLVLSGVTTALAFCSISLSGFPGLQAMGLFSAIGVVAALVATVVSLPAFVGARPAPTAPQRALARVLSAWAAVLGRHRLRVAVAVALVLAAIGLGAGRVEWVDDPSVLTNLDREMLEESDRLQMGVGNFEPGQFVVARAGSHEETLRLNEEVLRRLLGLVDEGVIDGFGSASIFLPSKSLQRRNRAAFAAVPHLADRIEAAFVAEGFRPGSFEPFSDHLAAPPPDPLEPEDLEGTPFERVLDLIVPVGGVIGAVTLLSGIHDADVLTEAVADLPGVFFVDQRSTLSRIYRDYRLDAVRMLGVGASVVFGILLLRYRRLGPAALACMPAAVGIGGTLAILGALGIDANVITTISMLMVLGMGVDYGIFAVDAAEDERMIGPSLTSLVVSCGTTLLVFGVLGLSSQPVLRNLGLSTGLGVLLAVGMAPVVCGLGRKS